MRRTSASLYIALGIGYLASGVCLGQAPTDLSACASVTDEKSRLKCYDEHMARSGHPVAAPAGSAATSAAAHASVEAPAATPKAAAPAAAARPTGPAERTPPASSASASLPPPVERAATAHSGSDEFGLDPERLRKKRDAESPGSAQPEELVGRVKAVSTRPHGEYRIELESGQVWVETLRTGGLAPEPGETVTIKRGTLGSFYLTRRVGAALRVKRIK